MRQLIYLFIFLTLNQSTTAQTYPQQYFRNPLAIPILLAGNFGECRPGHFHSGIDIKTEGRENLPVYAAADGYISRVKMEAGGFGHAIYITHPNGYTTLYAHLNDFFPALQKTVKAQQYQQEEWTCDLRFGEEKFPVKKGQQIAWSGNTGGSTAPHLHFEIRDSKTEHPLNPQLFGLKIEDNIAPKPTEIALYKAHESIYMQSPMRVPLKGIKGQFVPVKDTVMIEADEINIGVAVHDYMNRSNNTLSIYTAQWYANDKLIGSLTLDDIGYDETRYLNACADYKLQKETGIWFNSLFLLPNNQLKKIYQLNENGKIILNKNAPTSIRILLKDVSGNSSEINFKVLRGEKNSPNFCDNRWKPKVTNTFENNNLKFTTSAFALYDDICMQVIKNIEASALSTRWTIAQANIPLHQYFDLSIKPEVAIPFALNSKIALLHSDGKKTSGKKTTLQEGWYSTSVRNFGDYWLAIDTTAPSIKALQKNGLTISNKTVLRFLVTDKQTTVKSLVGSINGQWLCFEQRGNEWFYKPEEHCPKGKNKLMLKATDELGNERNIQFDFVR